jgi:Mg/Co/Ni transporter MgtE
VYTENAPDADAYASYYAMISPDVAASIYAQVVSQQVSDEEVKTYVSAFSAMDAENAAKIFDSMTDLTLVARILNQMSSDDRGAIMAEMDVTTADEVTRLMEPDNLPELNNNRAGTAVGKTNDNASTAAGSN